MKTMNTVKSADGTEIAYEAVGSGPSVILVDGATGFRAFGFSRRLAELLSGTLRVYCYDRRGRGESGNTEPSSLQREVEDLDALIEAAGGRAGLYGISSGGALALEAAATLGQRVPRLAIYEVPYDSSDAGVKAWREYRAQLSQLIADDKRGDAVALFMTFVGAPAEMVAGMRQTPVWPMLESVAPTLLNDATALGEDRTVPLDRAASVTAETLVMDGGASLDAMPFMRASAEALARAIPRARHRVLEGQRHDVDPAVIAPLLAAFFTERR